MTLTQEFTQTWRLRRYMLYRAVLTLQSMHSRSILGILWEPLLVLISAVVLASVWSIVMGDGDFVSYFAYICIGIGVWQYISKAVLRSASYIHKYAHSIANSRYPLLSYVITEILFSALIFIAVLPFLIVVGVYFNGFSTYALGMACLGTVIIFVAGVGFGLFIGGISAFLPDLREMIAAIMRIAFLVTPIIWKPARLGEYQHYLAFNPFHPFIEIVRAPLLGQTLDSATLLTGVGLALFLLGLGIIMLAVLNKPIRLRVV